MFINKNFSIARTLRFTGIHIIWLSLWVGCVAVFFYFTNCTLFAIPWKPVGLIGTAVAFYVGFKNNQAYSRLWEARKIWGGIVNSSRMWGANITAFVNNQFTNNDISQEQIKSIHKRLIHRHIAWLYILRKQLLVPTSWEHINQSKYHKQLAESRMQHFRLNAFDEEIKKSLKTYLKHDNIEELTKKKNVATQVIKKQSLELSELRQDNLLDDFRQTDLQKLLNDFYVHQGKAERIKKFPLPRQYGSMSVIFIGIFIFLLPFGLIPEFMKLGEYGIWMSIPIIVAVGWVYIMMELIGDYSENPFEGLGNDIPMLSLCRTIEIDLLEMLDESDDLPKPIEPIDGVLM